MASFCKGVYGLNFLPSLKKEKSVEVIATKKDRKVNIEEFKKHESLLNKKTSRKGKKE